MGYYPDVNPGDKFKPLAKLENDVRHIVNGMNGFHGGAIYAVNPGVIRVSVYNTTSPASVLLAGTAVSLNLSGVIAGDAYPAIAYSDSLPCYGVLLKDLNPGECGTCVLSGLASVQIASTPATGNFAQPNNEGVFVRGDDGVPILNVSGTTAVVMLGTMKTDAGIEYDAGPGINSDLLSGGTISTNFVEGNNIHIIPVEGSTNGAMEISADGGGSAVLGFPNYSGSKTYISASAGNTYINTFTDNRWIIGTIGFPTSSNMTGTVQIYVGLNNIVPANDFGCLEIGQTTLWGFDMPFTIPLPKNTKLQIYATDNAYVNAYAYPCI